MKGNIYTNLEKSLSEKPEFLRAKDLIELGLYKSDADVCWAKRRGQTPPSIRLSSRKIIYPKNLLVEWLRGKITKEQCEIN